MKLTVLFTKNICLKAGEELNVPQTGTMSPPSDNLPFDELSEEDMDEKIKELVTCMFQFARNLAQEVGEGKFEIQEVLDSLTNISLLKAYHATIDSDHFCCYCFRCRLHDRIQDTLIARDSPEFRLDYSSDFQEMEDLEPYPFYEIYYQRIRKKYF